MATSDPRVSRTSTAARSASASDVIVGARAATVVAAILATKVCVLTQFNSAQGFTLGYKVSALGLDALVAVALAGLVVLSARAARIVAGLLYAGVLAVVAANALLAIVLVVTRTYLTRADAVSLADLSWRSIVADFATWRMLVALGAGGMMCVLAPPIAARWAAAGVRRWRRALARHALPIAALGLGYVVASVASDRAAGVHEISLHHNPLVSYLLPGGRGPTLAYDADAPETFADLATRLLPVARQAGGSEADPALPRPWREPPNVILAILESTGAAALDDVPHMRRYHPFLSRARAHAISFRRFTSPVPESRAAFASLFCSKFPLPTEFGGDVEETLDLGRCLALPRVLAAHGVRTGFFSSSPFRDWIAQSFYERLGFEDLKDAGRLVTDHVAGERAVHVRDGRVMERDTVGALLQWTDRRCEAREPFFAVYYSWVAHAPYPASYPEGFPVSPDAPASMRYRRLVRVLDRQIERLYAVTLRDDCGRDTVLLVTGDHGEAFEEHPGNVFHGAYLWEENVHVPLLVLHPGLERVVSDRGASHVDIAPTIVDLMLSDLALAPEVSFYEGRSLFQAAQPWPVFSATLHGQGYVSSRFEQFKLIQGSSSVRLFDTDADPGERVDLSARHPELTTALRHALAGWAAHEHAITAVAAVGSPGRGARDAVPCR